MIKFFPERQTPDLYNIEMVNEIYEDLGLQTQEQKHDLKEILEHAAQSFIRAWEAEKVRKTEKQDMDAIEKTLPHLKKCKEIYESIHAGGAFIRSGFKIKDRVIFQPDKYAEILDQIIQDSETVLIDPLRTINKTKTRLILNWIWQFSDLWEASGITLSEGRCVYDGEYTSSAINILNKMLVPIKKQIKDPATITSSLLAEALKENRLYNKQGYLPSKPSGVSGSKSAPKVLKTIDFRE
jgi:hypothetical protein